MSDYELVDEELSGPVDLRQFNDDFDSAEAPSYDEIPDGKYQVRVETVRLGTSQNGNSMVKWDLIVLSGSQAGRHIFKNSVVTKAAIPFLKGDLLICGVQLQQFSDLNKRLNELLDVTLEVTKRTKGEYNNLYFNRKLQLTELTAVKDDMPIGNVPF